MFEVSFDEEAIGFLNKLEKPIKERIFKKIVLAKENPLHFFERLSGRTDFKLRVGDYRVIADIDSAEQMIRITVIGHRRNIYKNI